MRTAACAVALIVFGVAAAAQAAERYPARPLRMAIPSGAGGITDILGRVIATRMTDQLGQQVIVDNRPGASGIVGSQIVAKSTPDGYTLLVVFPSHPVNASLYPDIPYDTVNAFAPITIVSAVARVLIVNNQFPARSVRDLIELVILPVDGYHAAATEPDLTARVTREFIETHALPVSRRVAIQ